MNLPYIYRATIRSVYDGDTFRADWDLGANVVLKNEPFRLYGVDTPELRGEERPEGLVVRDFVRDLMPEGCEVIIKTYKDSKGKYGRYLATVTLPDGRDLATVLLEGGFAEVYP